MSEPRTPARGSLSAGRPTGERRTAARLDWLGPLWRALPCAVVVLDAESGRVVDATGAALALYDYALEELRGRKAPPPGPADAGAADPGAFSWRRRKDGSPLAVEVTSAGFRADGRRLVAAVVRNVREQAAAGEGRASEPAEKRQVEAELRRSNEALEQFAFVAAHDLQEPLRKIQVCSDLIRRAAGAALPPDQRQWLAMLTSAVERMGRLIKGLLDYSRVGRPENGDVLADGAEVLEGVLEAIEASRRESAAEVRSAPLPLLPIAPLHLEQLLQNLLSNAIKFRGAQPPKVSIDARRLDDAWLLSVADNGIGVPPDFLPRIFGLFEKLSHSGRQAGTGLGLAVCKKIVETYGGQICVDSALGRGTTVYFTLPVAGRPQTPAA